MVWEGGKPDTKLACSGFIVCAGLSICDSQYVMGVLYLTTPLSEVMSDLPMILVRELGGDVGAKGV